MNKTNILMPIAGFAKRFVDKGFKEPKPLLEIDGEPMIVMALDSLLKSDTDCSHYKLIFVVRKDHCETFDICGVLRRLFRQYETEFVITDQVTQGTLCSCLLARDVIDTDCPLVIYTPDICFESDFDIERNFVNTDYDGLLLTFKANSKDHSYAAIDAAGLVRMTAEKKVISNDAIVGVYCYRSGEMFLQHADKAIAIDLKTNNEFYVAPMYNLLITDGLKVGAHRVEKMHVLGTPEDVEFYKTYVDRYRKITAIGVCCDHSGFALKEELLSALRAKNIKFADFGAYGPTDSDHYDSLKPCAEYVVGNRSTIGIAFCFTGQGFNIAANKVSGLRSVLIHDTYTASMGRRHNAANFFCMPSRTVSPEVLGDIVDMLLNSSFDGGRHATRIQKINNDPLFAQ